MKKCTLMLLRHGKAVDASDFSWHDRDRSLTPKGREEAKALGTYVSHLSIDIGVVLSSPSVRTRETLDCFFKSKNMKRVRFEDALYSRGMIFSDPLSAWLDLIRGIHNDGSILIVWHNPMLTDFAWKLTGDHVPYMKKWSLLILEWKASSWQEISWGTLDVSAYITPDFLTFVQ